MEKKAITPINDLSGAVDYIKENAVIEEDNVVLKKPATIAFMSACGVPEAAHQQVLNAEALLLRGMYKVVGDKLVENIAKDKKAGIDVNEVPVEVYGQATALGNINYKLGATSFRTGMNLRTGEKIQTTGRVRLTVDAKRMIPKAERTSLADACRAAMDK